MTISKRMPCRLQIPDIAEKCNLEKELMGKRIIHRDTGFIGTILRAMILDEGTRYTVHFDHQPKNLRQIVWGDGLIIMGEVQY
ncbi:hypothetical protein [Bacillus sp. NPDC077027]|uniref:hypothetical protein n=1 Tax=Bacillus sp. NPDC077027 TaxID=3390548 RepID=UPI003CFD42C1